MVDAQLEEHRRDNGQFGSRVNSAPESTLSADDWFVDYDDFAETFPDADGTRNWHSAGSRTITLSPNGRVVFKRDGDIHNDGAPAVIEPDGSERWFRNDHEIPDPRPPQPTTSETPSRVTVIGALYEQVPTGGIAARLKHDVRRAAIARIIPEDLTYTVNHNKVRGSLPVVTITVEGLRRSELYRPDGEEGTFLTDQAAAIESELEQFLVARNRTVTVRGTDEFDAEFFGRVVFQPADPRTW